jgi:hypothetical protein
MPFAPIVTSVPFRANPDRPIATSTKMARRARMGEEGAMADYFLVLDAATFEGRTRPALAAAWRAQNFGPCRDLCAALVPAAHSYAERYHTGDGEPLLGRVFGGLPFDRRTWRSLVGEVLLFSALEIPEFQTSPDTLCCLLAPEQYRQTLAADGRSGVPPPLRASIQQAHWGSRDLTFGGAVYRPEHAGYNNREDVAQLAAYLAEVRPESWTAADLAELGLSEEECADELEFAREWFPALAGLYEGARQRDCVLVAESIY